MSVVTFLAIKDKLNWTKDMMQQDLGDLPPLLNHFLGETLYSGIMYYIV